MAKKENQVIKSNIRKNSRKSPSKKGIHISDLRKSLCLDLMENSGKNENKNDDENEDEMNLGFKIDEKEDKFKDINKAKKESEIILYKLQDDIIGFYKETNNQITYITNYTYYIYSINKQINSFRQQLRVSVVGEAEYNFSNKSEKNVEQLIKDMEIITFIINQVNQNIYKKFEGVLKSLIIERVNFPGYSYIFDKASILSSVKESNKLIFGSNFSIINFKIGRKSTLILEKSFLLKLFG